MLGVKEIKKIFIFTAGMTVLIFGLALMILPGPGIPIVLLGLILLATQFLWARRLLNRVNRFGKDVRKKYNSIRSG